MSASRDSSQEITRFSNPKMITIQLSAGTHTFAIRHSDRWALDFPMLAAAVANTSESIGVSIGRYDRIISRWRQMVRTISTIQMLWGVPFALALIHYFIYLFNRQAKEHLDYGLFAESIAGMVFFPFQATWSDSIWLVVLVRSLFKCSLVCSALFGLQFCHRVFDGGIPVHHRYTKMLVYALCALSLLVPLEAYYLVTILGFLAMAGIVLRAVIRGRTGAPIVMSGILILTITCGIQILIEIQTIEQDFSFPYIYGVLFLTLTKSIHLARSYARSHNDLAFQIEQVESLTEVAVLQENDAREREASVREQEAQQEILEAESAMRSKELEEARERQRVLEELESSSHELRDAQSRLVQTERMAAIGNLVAGIAHEINTPVGAIHSSHDTFVRATKRSRSP